MRTRKQNNQNKWNQNHHPTIQLAKTKKKAYLTRKQAQKFGGAPRELERTEPCTYQEIIQHYYFLEIQDTSTSFNKLAKIVTNEVLSVSEKVNPNLPLIHIMTINKRVRDVLGTAKNVNCKKGRGTKKKKEILQSKLNKLFDISACTCSLPNKLPCNDRLVKIYNDSCHLVCNYIQRATNGD